MTSKCGASTGKRMGKIRLVIGLPRLVPIRYPRDRSAPSCTTYPMAKPTIPDTNSQSFIGYGDAVRVLMRTWREHRRVVSNTFAVSSTDDQEMYPSSFDRLN